MGFLRLKFRALQVLYSRLHPLHCSLFVCGKRSNPGPHICELYIDCWTVYLLENLLSSVKCILYLKRGQFLTPCPAALKWALDSRACVTLAKSLSFSEPPFTSDKWNTQNSGCLGAEDEMRSFWPGLVYKLEAILLVTTHIQMSEDVYCWGGTAAITTSAGLTMTLTEWVSVLVKSCLGIIHTEH